MNIYYSYPLPQNKFNFEFTSFSGQVTRVIITLFICMGFSLCFIKLDTTILWVSYSVLYVVLYSLCYGRCNHTFSYSEFYVYCKSLLFVPFIHKWHGRQFFKLHIYITVLYNVLNPFTHKIIHMHFFCFALFICLHAIHSVFTLHTVNLHHRLLQLIKSVPLSLLQFNVFLCICLPSPLAAKDETSAESKKLTTLTTQFLYSNVSIFILFGTPKTFYRTFCMIL